jgi:hypothetical protein
MALPISVTYTFATATSAIPLSQLDANFTTVVNGINGIGNGTNSLANVQITGGNVSGLTTAIPVASGGTGLATITANNVVLGNGTSAVQVVAPGTSGNVLTSNGTTWLSTAPSGGGVASITFGSTGLTPNTATTGAVTVAGTLAAANGGTGLTSPGTSGNVLTSNGTAWVSQAASGGSALQYKNQIFSAAGSTTWTAPTGVTQVKVLVVGAGGGNNYLNSCCYSNGGTGGLAYGFVTVVPGTSYTVTVGAGGTGIASGSGTSNPGGSSSFGSLISATGGSGTNIAGSNVTNGTGSNGTLRNTYQGGLNGGTFIQPIGTTSSTNNTPLVWTASNNAAPGYPGAASSGSGSLRAGVNGLVYIEWVGA